MARGVGLIAPVPELAPGRFRTKKDGLWVGLHEQED